MQAVPQINTPFSHSRFLWGFVPLSLVWLTFHVGFFLFLAIGSDGCTKCPYDTADERWAAINQLNTVFIGRLVIDATILAAAFLLYIKRISALSKKPPYKLLFACLAAYVLSYLDFWGLNIEAQLRCGADCLAPDPLVSIFKYFGYTCLPVGIGFYVLAILSLRRLRT